MHLDLDFICLSSSSAVFFHSQWYLAIASCLLFSLYLNPHHRLSSFCVAILFSLSLFILTVEIFFDVLWFCTFFSLHMLIIYYTGLFINTSGISELDCATTKTDTAERSISVGRESLPSFFCTRGLGVLPGSTARG